MKTLPPLNAALLAALLGVAASAAPAQDIIGGSGAAPGPALAPTAPLIAIVKSLTPSVRWISGAKIAKAMVSNSLTTFRPIRTRTVASPPLRRTARSPTAVTPTPGSKSSCTSTGAWRCVCSRSRAASPASTAVTSDDGFAREAASS